MWRKWFPWRNIIKSIALKQGFLDPIAVLAKIQRFAQPSEVAAPIELLRLATILQARGLLNVQAIQHNLDWVWPYWVVRQFNPQDVSFIPRAFSITHINLTNRNWTAVGIPDCPDYPIVDPRGLLTPFYDSWSVDAWVLPKDGAAGLHGVRVRLAPRQSRERARAVCAHRSARAGLTRAPHRALHGRAGVIVVSAAGLRCGACGGGEGRVRRHAVQGWPGPVG